VRTGLDPEDVHQFRVGIRRLRSDLRTFAPLLKPRARRRLATELRWLAATVGPVRDSDVLAERLDHDVSRLRRVDPDEAALLSARLAHQNQSARASMLERLESDRYDTLRQILASLAVLPPVRSKRLALLVQPADEVAASFVRTPWQALENYVHALGATPDDLALHQVRILVKRTRYATEAVESAVVGAAAFAATLAGIQTILGDHHDTVVAEAWLSDAVRDSPAVSRLAFDLIFRNRSRRAKARAKWLTTWERASVPELRDWL
jgi:CHAD domain-containing protein